jgi:effector-binding domain-containing protein
MSERRSMTYRVTVETVPGQRLLVIRERIARHELGNAIMRILDQIYGFARGQGLAELGLNIVQYFDWGEEFTMEAGVIVPREVPVADNIRLSSTPAGKVATTTHWGLYDDLPAAHRAVLDWCKAHNVVPTGRNWEVYGHWSDDPAKRRTDVFHQLKET